MKRVVVIGSGAVAEALVQALSAPALSAGEGSPYVLVQVWGRNTERVATLAQMGRCSGATQPSELLPAEIYLLAVSDRVVGELAQRLSFGGAVVAHTAGSVPLQELAEAQSEARCGVFYPLQSFTQGRSVDFEQVPIFVEGATEQIEQELMELGRTLSKRVAILDSEQRARLHLAAVFACNFANRMFALAQELASKQGLPALWLNPLIEETVAKALDATEACDVQTGPALRHDQTTLDRHLALLAQEPSLQEIYQLISQNIWETSKRI